MKALIFGALFLLFTSSTEACEPTEISFKESKICANLKWITGPSVDVFNTVEVTLREESGLDLSLIKLNLLPWMVMNGHEHGSRPVTITQISPADYSVSKIYFMGGMDGQWFLKLQLLLAGKVIEETRTLINFN